jgi:hypothetical protein
MRLATWARPSSCGVSRVQTEVWRQREIDPTVRRGAGMTSDVVNTSFVFAGGKEARQTVSGQ